MPQSGKERKRKGDPEVGRTMRVARIKAGYTQDQLSEATNGLIYPRLSSEIENGHRSLLDLSLEQARAYAAALGYGGAGLLTATNLNDANLALPDIDTPRLPGSQDYEPNLELPYFETVAAGLLGGDGDTQGEMMGVDKNLPWLKGRDLSRMALIRVNGDSMVSPAARASIPSGSIIAVEYGAMPAPDDYVVAWIHDLGVSVLKKYQESDRDGLVLTSLNPRGPVFRANEHELDLRAVVRFYITNPP